MGDKPVLNAIRAILRFRDDTSIAEIAKMAGVPARRVLDVINDNGAFVWRNRKTGKIVKVDPRSTLVKKMRESGKYYEVGAGGVVAHEWDEITFAGNEELRTRLAKPITGGGFGDTRTVEVVLATPENIKAVEEAGLRPLREAPSDDRLWSE